LRHEFFYFFITVIYSLFNRLGRDTLVLYTIVELYSGAILLLLPQKGRSGALSLSQTFNLPHQHPIIYHPATPRIHLTILTFPASSLSG